MTLPPWLTGALRTELSGLALRRAAVSAVGLVTPLAVGAATGELRVATVVALGALLTGVIAISTPVGVPFLRMAASGVAVALSTVVGCATGGHPALAVPLVAVWGAAAGLLTTAGPGATTVGVQAITGLVVTGRFPLPVPAALEQGGLVLVGAGLQLLLAAVVRSPTADAAVRGPLSALATSLAAWCRLRQTRCGSAAPRTRSPPRRRLCRAPRRGGRRGPQHCARSSTTWPARASSWSRSPP